MNRRIVASLGCAWRLMCIALLAAAALTACGGGSSESAAVASPNPSPTPSPGTAPPTATGANVLAITVDRGSNGAAFNMPFASVTICVPGTNTCQTIDHVLVDTGSFGLRLLASAATQAQLLPPVTSGGSPVGACAHFVRGYMWGSVRRADVKLAGETAANLPIQIVNDAASPYAAVPTSCSNTGADFSADLTSNGVLGVGVFNQDCPSCATSAAAGAYYRCAAGGCSASTLPLASQVANPVASFNSANNNGLAIVLPAVPAGGVSTLSGSMIFGIGTQANNQLGSATVYTTDASGDFRTTYRGVTYPSFLDTGSNAIFFRDFSLPECFGYYCPAAPVTLSAVNTSASGVSGSVGFTIERIDTLGSNVTAANVGADAGLGRTFDWGLPFFFGRTVFIGIAGATTPGGPGPYWAY